MESQKAPILEVTREDLVQLPYPKAVANALLAGLLGVLGFLPLSVGTGLFDWFLSQKPIDLVVWKLTPIVLFLWLWASVGFVIAFLVYHGRPKILRKYVVGKDFEEVRRQYRRIIFGSFAVAFAVGAVGLAFTYVPSGKTVNLGLALTGLAYFGLIPSMTTTQILATNRQARFYLLQFLRAGVSGSSNNFLLRRGLRIVEERISEDEISTARSLLFLGCRYQIFQGQDIERDLCIISDWLVNQRPDGVLAIKHLLKIAEQARDLGISPNPTTLERIRQTPPWMVSLLLAALFPLVTAILSAIGIQSPIVQILRDAFLPQK